MTEEGSPDPFVSLSVALTGFTRDELTSTGSTSLYREWLTDSFPMIFGELLEAWEKIDREHHKPASRKRALRHEILDDRRLGPFARNVLLLWYTASWKRLPSKWACEQGQPDVCCRGFGLAYPESLVWKAAGTHPIGANPTGFGSWALPPTPPHENLAR